MKNKRAQSGEAVLMIYRLFLLVIMATTIYLIASLYFDYTIDTKNIEAALMGDELFDCITPDYQLTQETLDKIDSTKKLFEYCGLNGTDLLYVKLNITDNSGKEILLLEENEKFRESQYIYTNPYFNTEKTQRYKPGIFRQTKATQLKKPDTLQPITINLEVLATHEIK